MGVEKKTAEQVVLAQCALDVGKTQFAIHQGDSSILCWNVERDDPPISGKLVCASLSSPHPLRTMLM